MLNICLDSLNKRDALDVIEVLDNLNRVNTQAIIDKYRIGDIRVGDIMSIAREVIRNLKNDRFQFEADARIEELYLLLQPICEEDLEVILEGYKEEDKFGIEVSLDFFLMDLQESIEDYWNNVQED